MSGDPNFRPNSVILGTALPFSVPQFSPDLIPSFRLSLNTLLGAGYEPDNL